MRPKCQIKPEISTSARRSTLRLQYASALRRTLIKPLLTEQDAGIPAVIEVRVLRILKRATDSNVTSQVGQQLAASITLTSISCDSD